MRSARARVHDDAAAAAAPARAAPRRAGAAAVRLLRRRHRAAPTLRPLDPCWRVWARAGVAPTRPRRDRRRQPRRAALSHATAARRAVAADRRTYR
jgi:hypothetical protein